MIVITGSLVGTGDTIDELVEASLVHVHRSRQEPGCISHHVHRDVENPLRLVFVERWDDMACVRAHFGVTGSGEFVTAAAKLVSEPPTLEIYDAQVVTP